MDKIDFIINHQDKVLGNIWTIILFKYSISNLIPTQKRWCKFVPKLNKLKKKKKNKKEERLVVDQFQPPFH